MVGRPGTAAITAERSEYPAHIPLAYTKYLLYQKYCPQLTTICGSYKRRFHLLHRAYASFWIHRGGRARPFLLASSYHFLGLVIITELWFRAKGVDKYGANVDGYSPIYNTDDWSPSGDVYIGGTTGLAIWAVTLVGILAGGALFVYNTSALSQIWLYRWVGFPFSHVLTTHTLMIHLVFVMYGSFSFPRNR